MVHYVFILIHGTFARGAEWTTPHAPIRLISVVKALEDMLAEQKAVVETKLHEWRKKHPQAANGPPPQELLPVMAVRATHSQLAARLGLVSKDLIGQRLCAALDAGAIGAAILDDLEPNTILRCYRFYKDVRRRTSPV